MITKQPHGTKRGGRNSAPPPKRPKKFLVLLLGGAAAVISLVAWNYFAGGEKRAVQPPVDSLALMEKLLAEKSRPKEPPLEKLQGNATVSSHPPEVLSVAVKPTVFYRGVDLVASAEAKDAGNDLAGFRYRWLINDQQAETADEAKLPGNAFKRGDRLALEIVAFDANGEGKVFRTAEVVVPNGPPKILSRTPNTIESQRFETRIKAVDPDDDPISFSLEKAPAGMKIDAETGGVTWPINAEMVGSYSFRVVASDPEGLKSAQEYTLNFSMNP